MWLLTKDKKRLLICFLFAVSSLSVLVAANDQYIEDDDVDDGGGGNTLQVSPEYEAIADEFSTIPVSSAVDMPIMRSRFRRNALRGPNICGAPFERNCCSGWLPNSFGRCTIAICVLGCGSGRCMRPDLCLCSDSRFRRQCGGANASSTDLTPPKIVGPCFTQIEDSRCKGELVNVKCTQLLCCSTIGKAWGEPCYECPTLPCRKGFIYDPKEKICKDVDECAAIPNLCLTGRCINTAGSYTCGCGPNQRMVPGTGECEPIDFCAEWNNPCRPGICQQDATSPHGYRCVCRSPYTVSETGRNCTAIHRETCYRDLIPATQTRRAQCQSPLGTIGFADCCCHSNTSTSALGAAWGHSCLECPKSKSEGYKYLCDPSTVIQLGPDGNPIVSVCTLFRDICGEGGTCQPKRDGTYYCVCRDGYESDQYGKCQDIDECGRTPTICLPGTCKNTKGGHECECPPGISNLSPDKKRCETLRPCSSNSTICPNGVCVDMMGTYKCECNPGFKPLDSNHQACVDIDECNDGKIRCRGRNEVCNNTQGGYECICRRGYERIGPNGICEDIDECKKFCKKGKCTNMVGTLRCECPEGFIYKDEVLDCVDENECELPGHCINGMCTNTIGSFKCECRKGYTLVGNKCIADIKGFCFRDASCKADQIGSLTAGYQHECCCPKHLNGKRFFQISHGTYTTCERCPANNTKEWKEMCEFTPPNPCRDQRLCQPGGRCVEDKMDTRGYRCECRHGFQSKHIDDGPDYIEICQDIDDCTTSPGICGSATCQNTPGGYDCICPPGFEYKTDEQRCVDIDECTDLNPKRRKCTAPGNCTNFDGGFSCVCPQGWKEENGFCRDYRVGICWEEYDEKSGRCSSGIGGNGGNGRLLLKDLCCAGYGKGWGTPCERCPQPGDPDYKSPWPVGPDGKPWPTGPGGWPVGPDGKPWPIGPDGWPLFPDGRPLPAGPDGKPIFPGWPGWPTGPNGWPLGPDGKPWPVGPDGWPLGPDGKPLPAGPDGKPVFPVWPGRPGLPGGLLPSGCYPGYIRKGDKCEDIDECAEKLHKCPHDATCVNQQGSYTCQCRTGGIFDKSKGICVDSRRGVCYARITPSGQCVEARGTPLGTAGFSIADCCCSRVGSGWVDPETRICSPCPQPNTRDFNGLCKIPIAFDPCQVPGICETGRCVRNRFGFTCHCPPGFKYDESVTDCIDVDECLLSTTNICGEAGTCKNTNGSYTCVCPAGYEKTPDMEMCVDVDECSRSLYCAGGFCKNEKGSFSCECPVHMRETPDKRFCVDIDECSEWSSVCENGHCVNIIGKGYKCECFAGFKPTANNQSCEDIDECKYTKPSHCQQICMNKPGTFMCGCREGYTLNADQRTCRDIDECQMKKDRCLGQKCVNTEGSYKCECGPGFETGPNATYCKDIDECAAGPKMCGQGECRNTIGSYVCECVIGYTWAMGKGCVDLDECTTGQHVCSPNALCTNNVGSYSCKCKPGFVGDGFECTDINECERRNDCPANSVCVNTPGSYGCRCSEGYRKTSDGRYCVNIDECAEGGNSLCQNGMCQDLAGSFRCICHTGFQTTSDSRACVDIDECGGPNNMPLCANGDCINQIGSFTCICKPGYVQLPGDLNCSDFDECKADPHLCFNGNCTNFGGSYKCTCERGFELNADGTACIDRRSGRCFTDLTCAKSRHDEALSRKDCCCLDFGKSWYATTRGTAGTNDCSRCPARGTVEHNVLCYEKVLGPSTKPPPIWPTGPDGKPLPTAPDGWPIGPDGKPWPTGPGGWPLGPDGKPWPTGPDGWPIGPDGKPLPAGPDGRPIFPGFPSFPGVTLQPGIVTTLLPQTDRVCYKHPWVCGNGTCIDTGVHPFYTCLCPEGYRYNYKEHYNCLDINECDEFPERCGLGSQCTNTIGGYECHCAEGLIQTPDKKYCIDTRTESCWLRQDCTKPLSTYPIPRNVCCCSNYGKSWGSESCFLCPTKGTKDHSMLCGFKIVPICDQAPDLCQGGDVDGQCEDKSNGGYECICPSGFRTYQDQQQHIKCIDINECREQPGLCGPTAVCNNTKGSYKCECPRGYRFESASKSCKNIDECAENPRVCGDIGVDRCIDITGSYKCICSPGYNSTTDDATGVHRCKDIDECRNARECMPPFGVCQNVPGSYSCTCNEGFIKLSSDPRHCADVDECRQQPKICGDLGRCVNTIGSYYCDCSTGYKYSKSKKACVDDNECANMTLMAQVCKNAMCMNTQGSFHCDCNRGYQRTHLTGPCVDIDECQIRGVCVNGDCVNKPGSFECRCKPGFAKLDGQETCVDVRRGNCFLDNSCQSATNSLETVMRASCCCTVGRSWKEAKVGRCEPCPVPNSPDYREMCEGPEGGRGVVNGTIADINECAVYPEICGPHGQCVNTDGSYSCMCETGYKEQRTSSGVICVDVNECDEGYLECFNGDCKTFPIDCKHGQCRNYDGYFDCTCAAGFRFRSGSRSCEDINECAQPELYKVECGYQCQNTPGSYTCTCPPGYTLAPDGKHCNDIDECSLGRHNCANGLICKNIVGSFACICPDGYRLLQNNNCVDIDECASSQVSCGSGGICKNINGSYYCDCMPQYRPSLDRKGCIPLFDDYCYDSVQCSTRSELGKVAKDVCCCGGKAAWGKNTCERCPDRNSPEFKRLCPKGPGYNSGGQDIDECKLIPDACKDGGVCVNLNGTATCRCPEGYVYDDKTMRCLDENECERKPRGPCSQMCMNEKGSYVCFCHMGYMLAEDRKTCKDVDECAMKTHNCPGDDACTNTEGGFVCGCAKGYKEVDGQCVDIDECSQNPFLCAPNGTCANSEGSYTCLCHYGFAAADKLSTKCLDVNECVQNGTCAELGGSGECQNLPGSFQCLCDGGYSMHPIWGTCTDRNECLQPGICGSAGCLNTPGSFDCTCSMGVFNPQTLSCAAGHSCATNPCVFGCQSGENNGFQCGCPRGWMSTPNGHCVATSGEAWFPDIPRGQIPHDTKPAQGKTANLPPGERCIECPDPRILQTTPKATAPPLMRQPRRQQRSLQRRSIRQHSRRQHYVIEDNDELFEDAVTTMAPEVAEQWASTRDPTVDVSDLVTPKPHEDRPGVEPLRIVVNHSDVSRPDKPILRLMPALAGYQNNIEYKVNVGSGRDELFGVIKHPESDDGSFALVALQPLSRFHAYHLQISWRPIRDENQMVDGVVLGSSTMNVEVRVV